MNNLVVLNEKTGQPTTTSLQVAEVFGKRHDNVVRDIKQILETEGDTLNFEEIAYFDGRNRRQTCYEMTEEGFSLLVMGYTTKKAMKFKRAYIKQFVAMRNQLLVKPKALPSKRDLAMMVVEAEDRIALMSPKAEAYEEFINKGCSIGLSEAAKTLKLKPNLWMKQLRAECVFFKNKNVPTQAYIEQGYFEMKLIPWANDKGSSSQTRVTPQGMVWLVQEKLKGRFDKVTY